MHLVGCADVGLDGAGYLAAGCDVGTWGPPPGGKSLLGLKSKIGLRTSVRIIKVADLTQH